jgi:DNA-binding response OmpR family regulator
MSTLTLASLARPRWRTAPLVYRFISLAESVVEQASVIILLVEDEALIAFNLQEALEDGGFAVRHVETGEAALAVLDDPEIRVQGVITDIQFGGGIDGWAVARHAREVLPHCPIVYMSGDSAHEHTVHGVPDSVMLQKPFAPAQMIAAIATLLNASPPQL